MDRAANIVVCAASRKSLVVEEGWYKFYVGYELGKFRNCYIAHNPEAFKTTNCIGDTLVTMDGNIVAME